MNPKVIDVKESRAIDAAGRISTVIVMTYTVGTYGPFSLVTNATDISNGQAMVKMQAFANTLGQLPTSQG